MPTLDNLKKAAKRWLKALRAGDGEARTRLRRALPIAPATPGLRDVQHALARERGYASWAALRHALDRVRATAARDLEQYEAIADDLLAAHEAGDDAALRRLNERFGQSVTLQELRAEVDRALRKLGHDATSATRLNAASTRHLVAHAAGFESWLALVGALNTDDVTGSGTAAPSRMPAPAGNTGGMLQPIELRATLPIELQGGAYATTTEVWEMLVACSAGNLAQVRTLASANPGLARCEHNYLPPLHLAVREGHVAVVRFLLESGAYDPNHATYPYDERLLTLAEDRDYGEIAELLRGFGSRPRSSAIEAKSVHGPGAITFPVDEARDRFEQLVNANALSAVKTLLDRRPELVHDPYLAWSEGVLSIPANRRRRDMIELLMRYGATVPDVAKWGRAYYFKHHDIGQLLLERGMSPNHMNWQRTTLLHDMVWEGDLKKARLLLDRGADVHAIDDEFRSTPLGLAARWGRRDLVTLLLDRGADPSRAGAPWATPLAWATKKGFRDIAAELRAAGAS